MFRPRCWVLGLCLLLLGTSSVSAQRRGHIRLPHTHGATVLSTYIDAEARRIAAYGYFLEAAAIARLINVEADRQAMYNSLIWVDVYFQRKLLNRDYRRQLSPPYIDQQQRRDQMRLRIVTQQPEEALKGDLTDDLNWLLDRMVTDSNTYRFVFFDGESEVEDVDRPLSPDDIAHIRLREAFGDQGGGQSFRADDARLMHEDWPVAFQDPAFADERAGFEAARDQVLRDLGTGRLTFPAWRALQEAHDALADKFDEVYGPKQTREFSGNNRILIRNSGAEFLKSQAAAIAQAFVADNRDVFEGKYRFRGDSLVALVRHCADNGLEFAPPEVDDMATYRTLFTHLRAVYLHFNPNLIDDDEAP